MHSLGKALQERRQAGLYRERQVRAGQTGAEVVIDGHRLVNFCSNDYLGLASHPAVITALQQAATDYGVGSGAAHLLGGHSQAHHRLEQAIADLTHRSRALLFSTGYMANLGIVSALTKPGDHIYQDRFNHASLLDAALLARTRLHRYPHQDTDSLEQQLGKHQQQQTLIATDAVFSMDGDLADLPSLARIAKEHQAWLFVDDAHGFGVLGAEGRGSLEHFGLDQADVPILMGTFGKALGTFGAFVAGSEELIETLIQQARTYIYTTAPPPALAAATCVSLQLAQQEHWRRERLTELIGRFRDYATQLGLPLLPSLTPIQPIIAGSAERALAWSAQLKDQDILVSAIRPPTVPKGSARLRITFSAQHQDRHLMQLFAALEQLQ